MKALEKDRGRRYETANGLAADIQRYLADEPVLAGPPGPATGCGNSCGGTAARFWPRASPCSAWSAGPSRQPGRPSGPQSPSEPPTAAKDEADRNAAEAAGAAAESARLAEQRRVEVYPPRIKLAWQYWSDGDLTPDAGDSRFAPPGSRPD